MKNLYIIWNDNGMRKGHKGYYKEELTEKELYKFLKQLKKKKYNSLQCR